HDRTRCGSGRTSGAPARTRRRASSSLPRGSSPSGSALHIGRVLAEAGDAVHLRPVREGALGRIAVGGVALPCLLRGGLERAAVREAELPWVRAHAVHRIEPGGGLLV